MPALHLNDAGTWRQIQNVYVNDAGTWRTIQKIFVNDIGTWRQVYQRRPAESGNFIAGQNGTGGAYGYVRGSYGTGAHWNGVLGTTLTDGNQVRQVRDSNPTGSGGDGVLSIDGFSSDPGSTYISSLTANSITQLSSAASYAYLSGIATWTWTGSPFNFLAGNTYDPVTINF